MKFKKIIRRGEEVPWKITKQLVRTIKKKTGLPIGEIYHEGSQMAAKKYGVEGK